MIAVKTNFDLVRTLLRERAAISLGADKDYLIESRLTALAKKEGLPSVEELLRSLRNSNADLEVKVVEAMTTHETSFFRDRQPFTMLAERVVPDLIKRRGPTKAIRIWCGACSSGQEPYSLAMLLTDRFPRHLKFDILATDISSQILDRARAGTYTQLEVNRGLPANYLQKYFDKQGLRWTIKSELRTKIRFDVLNLMDPWPLLANIDVVFLRNVMIYMERDSKNTILSKVRRIMNSDGYLFVGAQENPAALGSMFAQVEQLKGCFQPSQAGRN